MKLYLTLEDKALKVERVVQINDNEYNPKILEIIEDMQDSIKKVKEESEKNFELINEVRRLIEVRDEARRLTINND